MSVTNPPLGLQNAGATHTAAQLRTYLASLQAGTYGVATNLRARGGVHPSLGDQLVVTQAGSPNMTVLVGSGIASVPGDESGTQGNYFVCNDAQLTLSVTAAHATLARIDLVVFNVRDAFYSGASNDSQLQVIAGTPAGSPVAPSPPANSLTIAQIAVGAAVSSIVNANITDQRRYMAAAGGVINARTEATRPVTAEIVEGQLVWTMDTKRLFLWDGTAYNQTYPTFNKINESVLGGTTASVTFSSIPGTYSALQLHVQGRSDAAGVTTTNLNVRFNGDTTAIYDSQSLFGQTTSTGAAETVSGTAISLVEIAAALAPANHAGTLIFNIPRYAGTSWFKIIDGTSTSSFTTGAGSLVTRKVSGRWRSTAAITSITLLPASGSFVTGTTFTLYGIL